LPLGGVKGHCGFQICPKIAASPIITGRKWADLNIPISKLIGRHDEA
jgi:hypothetical protein